MPCLWPGIREVQIDTKDFSWGEDVGNVGGIHADKAEIFRRFLKLLEFLYGPKKNAGITFYTNVVDLRVAKSVFQQEFAFAHSDLNIDGLLIAKYLVPGSAAGGFVFDNLTAFLQNPLPHGEYF